MANNNLLLPILLPKQISQSSAHTEILICQGVALSGSRPEGEEDCDDAFEEEDGPGRGNAIGGSKALYTRRTSPGLYGHIRHFDPEVLLFEGTVHLTQEDFDNLHTLICDALLAAMYVTCENEGGRSLLSSPSSHHRKMRFMFLDVVGGGNEGGFDVQRDWPSIWVSVRTVSNYFRHVLFALFKRLNSLEPQLIRCPHAGERAAMKGLII